MGVLALQGDVEEHLEAFRRAAAELNISAEAVRVKRADQLDGLSALAIPGGESTTIGKLAQRLGILDRLRTVVESGVPTLATCAGAVLLAKEVRDSVVGPTGQPLLVVGNEILRARTRGVGVLTRQMAAAYGVSGPIARASGLDLDLRRDEPYLAYGELFAPGGPGRVVTRTGGDCLARFECLLEQVHVSLDLVEACVERMASLPVGPINVKLPKVLRVPEGHGYTWTENPLGLNGYYLVSKGDKTPWRLKLRSASFNNVQVLSQLLPGCLISDMVAILGSMFFVVGDVDK